jgi:PAS domain S-box-containing protein
VRPDPSGKVVWFTIGGTEAEPSGDDLLAAWDVDSPWDVREPQPPAAPELREVVLRDMPTTLWLAAREHHQAMLRELVLYLAEHGGHEAVGTAPDLALADQARNLIWTSILQEIDNARAAGTARRPLPLGHPSPLPEVPEAVDLRLTVPPGVGAAFGALQDALDLGERLAVADLLLVRPGLPEIVAVRDWACEQVVAQLAGVPPSPWLGADQSHFADEVNDRIVPDASPWDATDVTTSPRGVVAADDANRIIAISDSLAETVGWAREEIVGRRVVALIPPNLREAHVAGFSRHLTTGEAHVLGVELQLPVLHRDGREILCTFMIDRTFAGSGRPIYIAAIEPVEG